MNTSEHIQISWATSEMVPLLIPLFAALQDHHHPNASKCDRLALVDHVEELLCSSNSHKLAVALLGDRKALGIAAVSTVNSINDPRPEFRKQVEIKELFVLDAFRSEGIGRSLMEWIQSRAIEAGASRIDWHVRLSNPRAIAFYLRFGAHVVDDRISMRKQTETRRKE